MKSKDLLEEKRIAINARERLNRRARKDKYEAIQQKRIEDITNRKFPPWTSTMLEEVQIGRTYRIKFL